MGDGSSIEWLFRPGTKPATWNPVRGCTRVSEGCRHCYAEVMAARFSEPGMWGHGFAETAKKPDGSSVRRWTGKVELIESMLTLPLRWRSPRTIFVNSTSDLFHESLPDEALDRIFAVMALCPQHTFIVLTKRPERMRAYMAPERARLWFEVVDDDLALAHEWPHDGLVRHMRYLPNVWLGVSAEDQATADERIPQLLETPAAIRFVSAEPLLSDLDLSRWLHDPQRESLPGTGSTRAVPGGDGRHDLASGQVDGWRCGVGDRLHEARSGRAQHLGKAGIPPNPVQGRENPAGRHCAPHCVDGGESAADPRWAGDQPHRREQTEQYSRELGVGDAPTERPALPHAPFSEEEGPARRAQQLSGRDRVSGDRDSRFVGKQRAFATGDRSALRGHSVDDLGDRPSQELAAPSLDWLIVGGESGPGARPMHPDWARSIRDQCQAAGVAYFHKQNGAFSIVYDRDHEDPGWRRCGDVERKTPNGRWLNLAGGHGFHGERVVYAVPVGKAAAGRLLDGREWSEFPEVRS